MVGGVIIDHSKPMIFQVRRSIASRDGACCAERRGCSSSQLVPRHAAYLPSNIRPLAPDPWQPWQTHPPRHHAAGVFLKPSPVSEDGCCCSEMPMVLYFSVFHPSLQTGKTGPPRFKISKQAVPAYQHLGWGGMSLYVTYIFCYIFYVTCIL